MPSGFDTLAQAVVRSRVLVKNVAVPKDDAEEIIEIMGNSASEAANGLHFLRLQKLSLKTSTIGYVLGEHLEMSKGVVLF